ncbi:MAG TPA: glycosyltransferase family 4 protein [Terriglobales bacterium]|nr:glycosyltransferase family 4 protein [Terriglobales bacterium]
MKILWVKAGKLLPVDTGGKIRSYNLLRFLARDHEVTLLTYYGGHRDLEYEAAIQKELPGTKSIHTSAPDSTVIVQGVDYLRRIVKSVPYAVSKFTHREVAKTVAGWLSARSFDVAVCDFLSASLNFPRKLMTPTVLFQHNVESSLWQRMASSESNPVKSLAFKIESVKMSSYERIALKHFHHIIAVSEHDRKQMLAMDPSCTITVVPTGVDTHKFTVAPPSTTDPPRIVFSGSMDWEPNIDAVEYFCQRIWPGVLETFPNAIFQIVGRNPHGKVLRLASKSVLVTGTVPSVAEYLRDASMVVVPLRIGGGTRLKIFEAMAMGKAVVATSIGAEGLEVQSGRDLMLADDAPAFTHAVLLLLRDAELRRKYEQAAVQLASEHDWSRIVLQFVAVLQRAMQNDASQRESTPYAVSVPS